MDALSGLSRNFPQSLHTMSDAATNFAFSSQILAALESILRELGMAAAAPLQRRYDGGVTIIQPDFSSLKPVVPVSGPFYPAELACQFKNRLDVEGKSFPDMHSFFNLRIIKESMLIQNEPESLKNVPADFLPYQKAVEKMGPSRLRSGVRFPENLSAFMDVGKGLIENGNKGCSIKDPKNYIECVKTAAQAMYSISKFSKQKEFEAHVMTDEAYRRRDREVALGDKRLFCGMNPEAHTNYRLALSELEEKFLSDNCFFRKEPAEILEFVKGIHRILMKNLPALSEDDDTSGIPGIFRDGPVMIFKKSAESAENELKDFFQKQGKSAMVNRINNIFSKLKSNIVLSFEEVGLISSKIYRPPVDAEKHMIEFAEKFKEYANLDLHPVALAAWLHTQIGNIRPFKFGNGRLARILANAILVRGGYEPLIFLNHEQYVQTILNDRNTPGAFAAYLAKLIRQQARGPQLLSDLA